MDEMKKIPVLVLAVIVFVGLATQYVHAISDVCEDVCFPRHDHGLFSCQRLCDNQDADAKELVRLPVGLYFLNEKIQTRLKPPVVESVEVTPENPRPGDAIKITVKLEDTDEFTPLTKVTVYYSFDDAGSWHAAAAEHNPVDEVFEAFVPLPVDAERISWFLRAVSHDDNAYLEIPCNVEHFPFEPGECLVPLISDTTYADYEDFYVDPALDIIKSKVGKDDDNYYFLFATAGDVSPGESMTSFKHIYFIGIFDPKEWTKLEPLNNTVFLTYAPYAPFLHAPEDCAIIKRKAHAWLIESSAVDCVAEKNEIMFRVAKDLLTDNDDDSFSVFLGTGLLLDDRMTVIKDYTGVTSVQPGLRVIEIQKEN